MPKVYISVGSNIGDRYGNIDHARSLLEERGVAVERVSPLYETQADCRPGQEAPPFINGVFEVKTDLDPEALLELLEGVERSLGRRSKGDWAPRPIDLDILFYDDRTCESDRLRIPHPKIASRWFVLKPLADLGPDFVHPVLGVSVRSLLASMKIAPPAR